MKQIKKIILIILISFCCMNNIKAEKLIGSNTCYNFNHTTGAYLGSGKNDCVKTIEGAHAYCVEFGKNIKTTIYARDGGWYETSREAIIAGIIIDKINAKYQGLEAYGTTAAILNTHFNISRNNAGSYNFYNKNTNIKNIYDEAVNEYNTYKVTTSLPTIKTSYNQTLNHLGSNTYISDKITISNLQKTYGGNNSVSYAISADKGAKICANASGIESSCSTTVSITGKTTYDFYIKANNVNPSEVIRVNITGNNQSTYPSSKLYSGGSSTQNLITKTTTTLYRNTSTSIQLTVPNLTNHTIQAKKVNEQGELLKGAVLEVYQDTPHQGKRLAYDTSSAILTYTSELVSAQDDDFFNHDYYLVEKLAPNGYLLKNQTIKIEVSNNENPTICYYNDGNSSSDSQVVDNERCNFANYKNVCLGSDGTIKDITENNDCIFEEPKENQEEQEQNENKEENKEEQEENKEENKITYEKACYKISTKTIEKDNTYCDNKSSYIKVEKARGNVVITHPNEKNKLLISKRAATGDDELVGASLKICTKSNYEANQENCVPAETIEKTKMEWISSEKTKTYSGIPIGNYYIIETIAPKGYAKKSIASEFSVDATGKIESKDMVEDTIIIKNDLTSLSISKQDMTTSKELKGATLSICISYLDENNKIQLEKDQYTGDCIPAILSDGTKATWESTDKPHKIEGLPSGTYFLVENIAPKNYSTAESIIFIVSEDGKILDKDRNLIENNKIIMKDKLISNPKTGELPIIIISIVGLLGLITGIFFYNKNNKKISKK